jgi:hypothetical protein
LKEQNTILIGLKDHRMGAAQPLLDLFTGFPEITQRPGGDGSRHTRVQVE